MTDNWKHLEAVVIGETEGGRVWQGLPAASSAAGAEWSTSGSRALRPQESEPSQDAVTARQYVQVVLERYLWLPGTPRVTSRHDRRCAQMLFQRRVPLEHVNAALLLGTARRTFRAGDPLPPVRALHYFLPVIEDLQPSDCDPGYVQYLERKLRPLAAAKQNESGGMSSRESVAGSRS